MNIFQVKISISKTLRQFKNSSQRVNDSLYILPNVPMKYCSKNIKKRY